MNNNFNDYCNNNDKKDKNRPNNKSATNVSGNDKTIIIITTG